MAWLPSHRKEVWEGRGWRGRWRWQGRGVEGGREHAECFGDAEKYGRRRGLEGMCGVKELRVWGLAEGAGWWEVLGRSGAMLGEAPPQGAFQCLSHSVP